jgi:fatty acid desaturase/predicted heme/steroid binding protein
MGTTKTQTQTTVSNASNVSSQRKRFAWSEVHKHNSAEDCWVVVKGKVYDVTSWVPKHPGGNQILNGAGREATALFQSYHKLNVEKALAKYEIGDVEDYQPYYTWESEFYTTIKKRVEEHFQKKGITGSDHPLMYAKSLAIVLGWFAFYYLAMFKGSLIAAIFLGVFHSQFGISVAHDGNHGSYSKSRWITSIAAFAMDIMGGSSLVWRHQHNIGHHPYANREGGFYNEDYDPDSTSAFPILRTHPNQAWKPHLRFQHIYVWFLLGFSGAKWAYGDVKWMSRKRYNGIDFHKLSTSDYVLMFVAKSIFLFYTLFLPFYLNPWKQAMALVLLFVLTNGYLFILNFAVNHLLEENVFPDQNSQERDWAKLQVLTSSNYATNSTFWVWFSGGLNLQIEHHLFPGVSHLYLPEVAPIVQQVCKEHNVMYTNKETYWEALVSYYRFMKKMAQNPAKAKKSK